MCLCSRSQHAGKWNIDSSVSVGWLILLVCSGKKQEQHRRKSENAFWCKKESKKNSFPPSLQIQSLLAKWEGNVRWVLEIGEKLCKWKLHYSARIMHSIASTLNATQWGAVIETSIPLPSANHQCRNEMLNFLSQIPFCKLFSQFSTQQLNWNGFSTSDFPKLVSIALLYCKSHQIVRIIKLFELTRLGLPYGTVWCEAFSPFPSP